MNLEFKWLHSVKRLQSPKCCTLKYLKMMIVDHIDYEPPGCENKPPQIRTRYQKQFGNPKNRKHATTLKKKVHQRTTARLFLNLALVWAAVLCTKSAQDLYSDIVNIDGIRGDNSPQHFSRYFPIYVRLFCLPIWIQPATIQDRLGNIERDG